MPDAARGKRDRQPGSRVGVVCISPVGAGLAGESGVSSGTAARGQACPHKVASVRRNQEDVLLPEAEGVFLARGRRARGLGLGAGASSS